MEELQEKRKRPELTGRMLKLLALISMVVDHIGVVMIEQRILHPVTARYTSGLVSAISWKQWWYIDRIFRCIGRLAFPIFLFLLVEGFVHTRNKRAYGFRLFLFALLSELPFDFAIFGQWFYPEYQNVLFTLWIAYITLWGMEKYRKIAWLQVGFPMAGCLAASLLHVDYGAMGVLTAVILYVYRGSRQQLAAGAAMAALESLSLYGAGALSFFFLWFYRGSEGKWPGKYFFYFAYPGHLLILALVSRWIFF